MRKWFIDRNWPEENGVPKYLLFPDKKLPAWLTIDDRCICFTGVLPSIQEIEDFKTWQQKD